jgi:pimeloyl-ACP methyl ester carboxylesterase
MPAVRVGDISIYYEDYGKGDPLLLIAGWGTDLSCWLPQIPEFSTKYRVIAFDNRGAGRTDAPDEPYSFRMMADDAVGLLDALGIGKAHILGMSMGGCIAQEIAIEHPERTRSLILAATTAAPGASPMLMNTLTAWTAAMKEGVSPKTMARMQLPYVVTSRFFDQPEMVALFVDAMAANPCQPRAYACQRQTEASTAQDTRAQLKQIVAPTLVLAGKEDIMLPVRHSEELAALIPGARLVVLEGGAHGFSIEIADKFNRAVLEFLGQIA